MCSKWQIYISWLSYHKNNTYLCIWDAQWTHHLVYYHWDIFNSTCWTYVQIMFSLYSSLISFHHPYSFIITMKYTHFPFMSQYQGLMGFRKGDLVNLDIIRWSCIHPQDFFITIPASQEHHSRIYSRRFLLLFYFRLLTLIDDVFENTHYCFLNDFSMAMYRSMNTYMHRELIASIMCHNEQMSSPQCF